MNFNKLMFKFDIIVKKNGGVVVGGAHFSYIRFIYLTAFSGY